jgi:DNA-binding HxlR family transcriptional regulator
VSRTVVDPLLCPVEVAARIVGQKWTLQIVKTLLDSQSRRFCELQDALGGVNPSTLSSRLKMLEDEGLIRRVQVSAIPPHVEYSLTEMGSQLQCVIREIAKWSQNWLCTPERVHEWQAHEEE